MTQLPRVKIVLRRLGNRWSWRLLDYFFSEVERGSGYRTCKDAKSAANCARKRYFESLELHKVKILLNQ